MASNLYATLADYKAFATGRGGTAPVTDTADDAVILSFLEDASRFLDDETGRQFYPSIESDSYDVPSDSELLFKRDVLQIISLTNGDGTSIAASSYTLNDSGFTPYFSLTLKSTSGIEWEADSDGETAQVIDLAAWCGYREKYSQRAWVSVGTLGTAITDTTTLAFTMTAGHTVAVGQILKIDTEIYNVATVSTNTITPNQRGDNGSTAATHLINAPVYKWIPERGSDLAVLELANNTYHRRFGQSIRSEETITAAGIVLSPREIPHLTKKFITSKTRAV